jgi:hypothetical protein
VQAWLQLKQEAEEAAEEEPGWNDLNHLEGDFLEINSEHLSHGHNANGPWLVA